MHALLIWIVEGTKKELHSIVGPTASVMVTALRVSRIIVPPRGNQSTVDLVRFEV
jgi:hypothetical protein